MSAGCLGTSEWKDIKGKWCQDFIFIYLFFFQARQKSLLKLALSGAAEYESGRENACGIGIRLMSNKKQGVGVMWRGKNGVERGDVEGLC